MRIIAGDMKGRTLFIPRHASFRPTTDRVREALFNMLNGTIEWQKSRVCDLFAGSGSLGLEALSRGAMSVTFVENSRESRTVLERNIRTLGVDARTDIQPLSVASFCVRSTAPCELVFADPPYDYQDYAGLLACCARLLRPDGLAVVEHAARVTMPPTEELHAVDRRVYGATALSIYRSHTGEAS